MKSYFYRSSILLLLVFCCKKQKTDSLSHTSIDTIRLSKNKIIDKFRLNSNDLKECKYSLEIKNNESDSIEYIINNNQNIIFSFDWPKKQEKSFHRRYYYNNVLLKMYRTIYFGESQYDLNNGFFDYSSPRIYLNNKDELLLVFDIKDVTGLMSKYSLFILINKKNKIAYEALLENPPENIDSNAAW